MPITIPAFTHLLPQIQTPNQPRPSSTRGTFSSPHVSSSPSTCPHIPTKVHQPLPAYPIANSKPPPILRLDPIYTLPSPQFRPDIHTLTSSPFWRYILLSDGHIVQHLSIISNGQLSLSHISTTHSPSTKSVQRRIAIRDENGVPHLFATSTWSAHMYNKIMTSREHMPLGEVFRHFRLAVSRGIDAIHFGTCEPLEPFFGVSHGSRTWARDYVFRQDRKVFLSVHEIFSPALDLYLGPVAPPDEIRRREEQGGINAPDGRFEAESS